MILRFHNLDHETAIRCWQWCRSRGVRFVVASDGSRLLAVVPEMDHMLRHPSPATLVSTDEWKAAISDIPPPSRVAPGAHPGEDRRLDPIKAAAQVRKAVGEAAWRAAISDIPVEGSGVSMADAGGGGLEDARAAEADWMCEGCPFRRAKIEAAGCLQGSFCVHETECSRRGKLQRGELCTAGFWALLPSWGRSLDERAISILAKRYGADHA